jgi:HK97 family phage portal protein
MGGWLSTFLKPERKASRIEVIGVQGRPDFPTVDTSTLSRAFTTNELVYACIQAKATAAMDPRLIVQQRLQGDEWQEVPGHPLRRLMMRPNPWMDEAAFMRALLASWDIARIVYIEIVRGKGGEIAELYPLNPAKMKAITENGKLVAYEWRDGNDKVRFKPDELLIRRGDWTNPSPLAVALGSVDADSAQTDYVRAFFNNAGVPSGILKVKGTYSQEKADALREKWKAKYGRAWGRQHDVAVLDDNAEYQGIGARLDQLNSEAIRSLTESRICMVFGVPPLIVYAYVGLLRATYSNLKEAWSAFWDATMSPSFKDWKSWLTWNLLVSFHDIELLYGEKVRLHWDLSQVAALQDDVDATYNRAEKAFRAGAITLNQYRTMIGQPEDPAGDYYLRLVSYVPFPAGQAPKVDADDVLGSKGRKARRETKASRLTHERRIENATRSYLVDQYDRAADGIAKGQDADQLELDFGDEVETLMRRYYPLLVKDAFNDATGQVGVDIAFDLENERVQDVLDKLATKIRDVADTTRDEVRSLAGRQAAEGWSNEELAKAIREHGAIASQSRSLTIARTESATGHNMGTLLGYSEAGVTHVEVLDGDDDDACALVNGAIWTIAQAQANPIAHPNCTRSFAAVVED